MIETAESEAEREHWRRLLSGEDSALNVPGKRFFRTIPSPPRCKMCNVPFAGPGGVVFRQLGFGRWSKNPRFCDQCHKTLAKLRIGGAEVPVSVLFADVRGSTSIAEQMRPLEFRALIDRFYQEAAPPILDADGLLDKFLGDGVLGLFIPVWAGAHHADRAIGAARDILRATGNMPGRTAHAPVGVGVDMGVAYVGVVGEEGEATDFTALGDPLNTAARLAAAAGAGEVLASATALDAAGLSGSVGDWRDLDLKGKAEPVRAGVLGASVGDS
jgi:adenylate cyclase